ncbi:MAG TPA: molybdopterin-dependent oxidoreductase, partial [Polyangia bacterium]
MGEKLERRTLIEWMGKGAVLALGAPLFQACAAAAEAAGPDGGSWPPADGGGSPALDAGAESAFPFQPGDGRSPLFESWGERTVDAQSLTALLAHWRLTIDGWVEAPKTLSFLDLVAMRRTDQTTDFHCVEGWSIDDVPWSGVPLSNLFDLVRPTARATYVTFHTVNDQYNESLPLSVAREPHALLGYGIEGST